MVHNADRLHEREWCLMQKLTHEGVVAQFESLSAEYGL